VRETLAVLIVLTARTALLAALAWTLSRLTLLLLARLLAAALLSAALLATLLATLLLLTRTLIRILVLAHFASFRCWSLEVQLRCSPARRLGQRSAYGLVPRPGFRDRGGTVRNPREFSWQRNNNRGTTDMGRYLLLWLLGIPLPLLLLIWVFGGLH
jgi:hypothetical protein